MNWTEQVIAWLNWHRDVVSICVVSFALGMVIGFALVGASLRRPS